MKAQKLFPIMLAFATLIVSFTQAEVRQPIVAGTFYPADSASLSEMVVSHLEQTGITDKINGEIIALIVPHAGLIYSGRIAAHSYGLLKNTPINNVILCGPSHRFGFKGVSVYGPGVNWKTPLGTVACNDDLCRRLVDYNPSIMVIKEAHINEHSLEVQLPYLQTVLPDFKIVPIVLGSQDAQSIDILANALSSLKCGLNTIMIASTDLQHYRPASEGWKMDSLVIVCLENLDTGRLEHLLATSAVKMCGGGATLAVMKAAITNGADRARLLRYGDSGDLTGDKSSVVGYLAAVLYRSPNNSKDQGTAGETPEKSTIAKSDNFYLSEASRKRLLQIARESIEYYLANKSIPKFDVTDNLRLPGAAFVTLEKNNQLRGCIGHIVAVDPLYETVATCAVQAAFGDGRFPPVHVDEIKELHIEISVLTPMQKVESLDDIKVGRDGLMIVKDARRGLILPQVAIDYELNRTEFLQHTCDKAGLPSDAYKSTDVVIYRFQALIFGE